MPSTPQDHKSKKSKDKYAATVWGSPGGYEDIEVPSGQRCLVRRPGVQLLMKAGVLRDIDTLSSIIASEHIVRVEGESPTVDVDSLVSDASAINNVLHVVDRVVCHIVVKPEVKMTPNDVTAREDDVVYCDMIDVEDRMFLFNYAVGGTRDVEQFRQGTQAAMGSVESVEDVELQA